MLCRAACRCGEIKLVAIKKRRELIGNRDVVEVREGDVGVAVQACRRQLKDFGTPTIRIDGVDLPTGPTLGWFTQPLAGTDCPALTVPIARDGRLPIGVQLFAPPRREDWLFRVAMRLEAAGLAIARVAS